MRALVTPSRWSYNLVALREAFVLRFEQLLHVQMRHMRPCAILYHFTNTLLPVSADPQRNRAIAEAGDSIFLVS